MQNLNTNNYLIRRVKNALRTDKLEPKDLSLDMLMTAYASVYEHGDAGNDHRISLKVPALATYYANILMEGKFVVINDVMDMKWYFVMAHNGDLIAVSYAIGPWVNVYAIKSTSEDTLKALGITSAGTADLRIIDRIFGFKPWTGQKDIDAAPATAVVEPKDNEVHWMWHSGTKAAEKKKGEQGVETATAEVLAPSHIVEHAGEPTVSSGAQPMGNQMQRAIQNAGLTGHQGRRHERRAAERRQHELNTTSGEKK